MSDLLTPHDGPALRAALQRLQARHPIKVDLGLERIDRVCAALGRPERRLPPVIHVAGTNGKGSTCAFVRAMAEAARLRVHALTSPHLVRFVERLRLADALAQEDAVVEALLRVEAAAGDAPLSFFEAVTAAQFLLMAETPADLAVVEVGLGGRFDATNLVAPAVSVIAPVDMDHREFLGSTLAAIAGEKAGIVKPGAPAVVARQAPEAMAVIAAEAERVGAPLLAAGRAWDVLDLSGDGDGLTLRWGERRFDLSAPALPGAHQRQNAALAAAALLAWGDARIDAGALARGVTEARWPARLQRLEAGPLGAQAAARGADLWLDGAHNPHAALAVADFARALHARDGRPVTLIVGLLATKDAAGVFAALHGAANAVIVTGFASDKAAAPEALARAATGAGVPAAAAPDVTAALAQALDAPGAPPHVVIAGSLYLAGEVLGLSRDTWPE